MYTYKKKEVYLFLLYIQYSTISGANILALVPITSFSHHIWNRALILELAARGHQVTVVTPDLEKTPVSNITEIHLEESYAFADNAFDYESFGELSPWGMLQVYYEWGEKLCDHQLNSKGGKQLLNFPDKKLFDLIILETVVNECFLPFITKFGSPPVVGLSAFGNSVWISYMMGSPEPFSYSPSLFLPYTDKMNFISRLTNTVFHMFTVYYRNYIYMPKIQNMIEHYFGKPVPSVLEIEKNFSVVLVNSILGVDYSKPLLPSIIPVGGMHLSSLMNLPEDILHFLESCDEGAILFSLGSNLRSDRMTDELRLAILGAFSELPQKILWKYESDTIEGKPDNVKISNWLPQSDILGHPKVKLFISHCGLLSTQEAMYHGVPVIGIPFFEDQHINIRKLVSLGGGESLKYNELSKSVLLQTIQTVLNNSSYSNNMKRVSRIFRDQIQSPLERAVFWTEYTLRNNGASHLRSAALDISWYEYLLLDVILFLLFFVIIFIYITFKLLMFLFNVTLMRKIKQH